MCEALDDLVMKVAGSHAKRFWGKKDKFVILGHTAFFIGLVQVISVYM